MPYILSKSRELFNDPAHKPQTPGELNYVLSQQIRSYLAMRGLSYNCVNDIVGVLECLKMEFYRKLAGPYEDKKEIENGTVW